MVLGGQKWSERHGVCDPRVHGALLFRCMVAGLYWHFSNFPWLCKVFLQTFLHFASQFRNLQAISKLGGDFATISKLGDHFIAISKLKSDFVGVSQLQNEGNYAAKWHSCAKSGFAAGETPFQMVSRLRNSSSALRACLQTTITSSFHIQITYCLKRWTPDFPRFETRYGMHNLSSKKCFKNVSNSSEMEVRHFRSCFEIPFKMELWLRNWDFSRFGISQPFRSCEMRVTVLRNSTRVPKSPSQLRNTLRNGTFGAKSGFTTSQCVSQLRNGCSCATKWHSCAKNGFAAVKIFAERAIALRTGFAAKCRFRRGCEISQRLQNLADPCFSPVFPLFLPCF
uniref:Uncharacterized protein n=1 Tax=Vitis vinifera TaxID=29760 RepID=A5AID4_VITVI|nr:hypothetical protein VITISV_023814 [Vitis vinifera]